MVEITNRDGCPICPYCDWSFGEWMDGKTKAGEHIKCPNCEKTYFCRTIIFGQGYEHIISRLGRKPRTDKTQGR